MLRGFEIVLSERDRREGGEIDVRAGVDYDKRKQSREQRIESRDPVEPGREGEPRKTHKTFDEVVLNYRARLLNRKTSANCGKKKSSLANVLTKVSYRRLKLFQPNQIDE